MKKILDTIVFGKYNLHDVFVVVGVAVAFWILLRILLRVFKKEKGNKYSQFVECINCGWHGRVSTFAGRCPKCNEPLGDQKIRQKK
jgi:hypothetical protein